jgi:glutamate 5-kinase
MLIVIKVGSALLSNKKRQLDVPHLKHIVQQIADIFKDGHQVVLVSSGAVNAGRGLVNFEKEKRRYVRRQMYASLGQASLMKQYHKAFSIHKIYAAEALITRENFADRGEHNNLVNMIKSLLNHRIVPILNENDAVANTQVNFGGNDLLSGLIAASIKADRLIILTDVEHLYNKDPSTHKDAKAICEVEEITAEVEKYCSTAKDSRSMGGMITKIKAAKIATECGIPTYFANGLHKNIVKTIIEEEEKGRTACIGTYFKAHKKKHTQLKYWLKHCSLPTGTLVIDDGAEEAIKGHKSLLLPGIKGFTDSFQKHDTVLITNKQNEAIGTGKIDYSSAELHHAIALGKKLRIKPIIHCDNISLN